MAAYCLPKSKVAEFLKAFPASGDATNLIDLQNMDSVARRAEIAKYVGEEHASEVNARFEQKLLLKYKFGLFEWVKELTGVDNQMRENIVDKISKIDERILNPNGQQQFLSDLASKKVGAQVTEVEAKQIFDLAKAAEDSKARWEKTLGQEPTKEFTKFGSINRADPVVVARLEYGNAVLDLRDAVESMKPDGQTWVDRALNIAGMPKTVATGILHFSALGVQSWGMISHAVTWKAAIQQFRFFADEANYRELQSYIISHPDYQYAQAAKLGLTDIKDTLSVREEAMPSSYPAQLNEWAAKMGGKAFGSDKPLPINILGASGRGFTGFLNYVRFNRYVDLLNAARSVNEGADVTVGSQLTKDLASVVNNFTGRSNLGPGEQFANTQVVLNNIFFAPRKMAATVQMFNPIEYGLLYKNARATGNYTAINGAIRQLTGSLIATGSLLYLASNLGYEVNFNPTSQEFLKIKTPSGEKLDVTGGNAIYTRLWARILTGKTINNSGKQTTLGEGDFHPTTRADLAIQYVRGKLSPVAGALTDFMYGQDAIGRPFSVTDELKDRFQPIIADSLMNYYYQNTDKALSDIPVLSALFGVAVESPLPPYGRNGVSAWGEPISLFDSPVRGQLDRELLHNGVTLRLPPPTINGVKLNKEQDQMYIHKRGSLLSARLNNIIHSQSWTNFSPAQRQKQIQQMINSSTKFAAGYVKAQSAHSDNDITVKSFKANIAKKQLIAPTSATGESAQEKE